VSIRIVNKKTAALSAMTLMASGAVAFVGLQGTALAADSSNTNAYQCSTVITAGEFNASTQPDYTVTLNGPDTVNPGEDIVLTGAYTPTLTTGPVALANYTASNRISVSYQVNGGAVQTVDGAFGITTAPANVPANSPVPNPPPGDITIPGAGLVAGDSITILPTQFRQELTSSSLGGQTGGTTCTPVAGDEPSNPLTVTIPVPVEPALSLEKTSPTANFAAEGDEIEYEFEVTNSGGVDLDGPITINDPLVTADCPATATLVVGDSVTCTATYVVDAGDVAAESVVNTATAAASFESDPIESEESTVTVDIATPAISLTKTADQDVFGSAGEELTFTLDVENTGNATLTDVVVTDDLTDDVVCDAGLDEMAPGDIVSCVATYEVTADDVTAGTITNTATADAATQSVSDESSATVNIGTPGITFTKNATTISFTSVGDVVDYTLTAVNTGQVTLTNLSVVDALTSDEACPAEAASVAPGDTVICTASYTVTQADIDAGEVTNTANATATLNGETVDSAPSSVTIPFEAERPTQDVPSRVTEKVEGINCFNQILQVSPWEAGNDEVGGGPAGDSPTITLDLTPAVPEPGAPVTVSVQFDEGIANGPTEVNGSIKPVARVFLTGGVEDELILSGIPYQGIVATQRLPGQKMTLEDAFLFPESGETVFAELDTITFDSNSLSTGGTFNWPGEGTSQFTTVCNKGTNPSTDPQPIGLLAAVPFEGELPPEPPAPPAVPEPTDTDGDDDSDNDGSGSGLPQTGPLGTTESLILAAILFQLGLILAVRSVRSQPRRVVVSA
jgi:uncharacterized repeat protein (TIGR01451 family)